jgi:phosphoribosyl 1,2-cyclic phosphate phosphodiesterase
MCLQKLYNMFKFTLLGTGTSQGIPVMGCDCPVCISRERVDKRLRTAAMLTLNGKNIIIDSGPDFRQQMLREKVQDIEAILFTHEHNDHVIGLDDVRPFNFKYEKNIALYATPRVQADLKQRFAYAFEENPYPGAPRFEFHTLDKNIPLYVSTLPDLKIIPIEIYHGKLPILGFRFGDLAYLTDFKTIEPDEYQKLIGVKTLIISALHHKEHHSHQNLEQALAFIETLKPAQSYLIHMSHRFGKHRVMSRKMPKNVFLGYDGLVLQA